MQSRSKRGEGLVSQKQYSKNIVDLSRSQLPRDGSGYYIFSTGEHTGYREVGREGNITIYERTLNGEGRAERN